MRSFFPSTFWTAWLRGPGDRESLVEVRRHTMKPPTLRVLGFSFVLVALACGDDDAPMTADGGTDGGTEPAVLAIFDPSSGPMAFGRMPYPDDLYLDESGHIALSEYPSEAGGSSAYLTSLRDGLATLDGFSGVGGIYIPFDGELDSSSLPQTSAETLQAESSVFLVDADPASATPFARLPAQVRWLPMEQMIVVRPVRPLAPGQPYAVVVTSRVLGASGRPVEPAPLFASLRDSETTPEDPTLAEAFVRYGPVLDNTMGVRSDVVAVSVFRVQTATAELETVREQVQDEIPDVRIDEVLTGEQLDERLGQPVTGEPGLGIEGGVLHTEIGWLIHGTISVPNFLNEDEGVHGRFERTDSGEIGAKRIDQAPFTLVLPLVLPIGSEAPPLVIFQHGVAGQRSELLGLANTLAAAGYASIAIDAPFHGLRARGDVLDEVNNFTGALEPDGFGDLGGVGVVLDFVGALETEGEYPAFHPIYFRDALRQSAADLHSLVRAIRAGDWGDLAVRAPELESVSLAESRLAFVGNSLGGIIGALFVATEPEIAAAVLCVTGGYLGELVQNSLSYNLQLLTLLPMLNLDASELDYENDEPLLRPGVALWQSLLDAGDAALYAGLMRERSTHLLMTMVRNDETVPNRSTELLARAFGLPIVGGEARYSELPMGDLPLRSNIEVGAESVTRGLYVYERGSHGSLLWREGTQRAMHPPDPPFMRMDPVPVSNPVDGMQSQIIALFESWRAGNAEIVLPTE
ncbi:MAG: pimeloyl-ACP methyl ester carboxylesterase [Polyangiales bacterium]|jgi:pimeloyl-ACP methyl ester carboxylesterase